MKAVAAEVIIEERGRERKTINTRGVDIFLILFFVVAAVFTFCIVKKNLFTKMHNLKRLESEAEAIETIKYNIKNREIKVGGIYMCDNDRWRRLAEVRGKNGFCKWSFRQISCFFFSFLSPRPIWPDP